MCHDLWILEYIISEPQLISHTHVCLFNLNTSICLSVLYSTKALSVTDQKEKWIMMTVVGLNEDVLK